MTCKCSFSREGTLGLLFFIVLYCFCLSVLYYLTTGHRPAHYCSNYNYSISHNISDHLTTLHKEHFNQTKDGILNAKSHSLKKLLRKLYVTKPYEITNILNK